MSLRNLLDKGLISCSPESSIKEAASLMEKNNVGAVLVIEEGGKPAGIITDRDIVVRCVVQGADCQNTNVGDIMTKPVATIGADSGIFNAIHSMKEEKVRRIPVVDEQGRALGLISLGDVFQLLGRELGELSSVVAPEEPKLVEKAAA